MMIPSPPALRLLYVVSALLAGGSTPAASSFSLPSRPSNTAAASVIPRSAAAAANPLSSAAANPISLALRQRRSILSAGLSGDEEAEGSIFRDDGGAEKEKDVLLRLSLSTTSDGDDESSSVLESVRSYVKSFPFAAVLPVQPLTYIPTDDGTGVKVTFLRKKTKEKGSVDGGIDFDVRWGGAEEAEEDDCEERRRRRRIDVVARRNSEGQTVSKTFSEMLVVKSFVRGISGEDEGRRPDPELMEKINVESVFHLWMQS